MRYSDIPRNPPPVTLRWFSAFCVALCGLIVWRSSAQLPHQAIAALALLTGIAGLIRPAFVRPVFVGWLILVFPVGWLVSRIALAALFYGILLPIGLLFRLTGRDRLQLRPPSEPTLWTDKAQPPDPASYFRQS